MTPRICEPEVLRSRALAHDPALIPDLLACFRQELEAFLLRRCGNTGDAEDALQDAFESAIKYIDTYRGESSMRSWLYRLASSACTRMRRGRKNDPKLHQSIDVDARCTELTMMSEQVEAMLEARLMPLQEALLKLSNTDRNVLLMRDGQGLSTTETAEVLELTEPAVKARLHRARKQVREHLVA